MAASRAYIALGGNLDFQGRPPVRTLEEALIRLGEEGVKVLARSRWYASPAWPDPSKPAYVNGVAEVESALSPEALLTLLLEIETAFGRTRDQRWDSRTLDLDLIDAGGAVSGEEGDLLVLPHPRAHERAFVLLPLQEIAPDWRHPESGAGIAALIAALPETEKASVKPLQDDAKSRV
jgi:2-amino-4-hydroxy-6-hydroxymethyldihydropteridine diphosphokinase